MKNKGIYVENFGYLTQLKSKDEYLDELLDLTLENTKYIDNLNKKNLKKVENNFRRCEELVVLVEFLKDCEEMNKDEEIEEDTDNEEPNTNPDDFEIGDYVKLIGNDERVEVRGVPIGCKGYIMQKEKTKENLSVYFVRFEDTNPQFVLGTCLKKIEKD